MALDVLKKRVAVIGAGPVGSFFAILMAKRGSSVTIYEARQDFRLEDVYRRKSINLALSIRGMMALRRLGLDSLVSETAIPMYGRIIHDLNGNISSILPYGLYGESILSMNRRHLSNILLNAAEKIGVTIKFEHKCVNIDPDELSISMLCPS